MAFKIITDGGYDIVFEHDVAREYISAYKDAGIFRGLKFLPWLTGDADIHKSY